MIHAAFSGCGNSTMIRNVASTDKYPMGLSSNIYRSGSMWSSANMEIWDVIGRLKSDEMHLMGISATHSNTEQPDAANALYAASIDLGFDQEEIQIIRDIFEKRGYDIGSYCGDGIVADDEDCDGNVGYATCANIGCSGGNLTCGSDCKWNYTLCASDDELVWDMTLTFDGFPRENIWLILDEDGDVVKSGGDGNEYDDLAYKSVRESFCLDRSQCYNFNLHDTKGDGIKCDNDDIYCNAELVMSVDGVPLPDIVLTSGFNLYQSFGTNCTS